MGARLTPGAAPGDRDAIASAFARDGLSPHAWGNAPGDRYAVHDHDYDKILYCVRGSITFDVAGEGSFDLKPGDRLDIESGTPHSAVVGAEGVTCMEAARRA